MSTATYTRPKLYPKQERAFFNNKRFSCIEATVKAGKTVAAMAWLLEQAILGSKGQNFWWVAPGYNQADIAFRRFKDNLTPGSFTAIGTPSPKIIMISGPTIWFKSADNPDALYGEDVYGAVIDEASRISESSWIAVRSTLTATRGPCRMIGNVVGRKNWFFRMCRRAENGELNNVYWDRITADDAVAAGILDREEIDDAHGAMSEAQFRQLYYAEAVDDTGNPFGSEHIRLCTVNNLSQAPIAAWGIDVARSVDYFVIVGLDADGNVSAFHRWRGKPWQESIRDTGVIVGSGEALVDSTGVGDPVLEALQRNCPGTYRGFKFSSSSKQALMERLAVGIQQHEITFPNGVITNELHSFEYIQSATGIRYSAPSGEHDDCVMALALAWKQLSKAPTPSFIQAAYSWRPPFSLPIFRR